MNGPVEFRRDRAINDLLAAPTSWDELLENFKPAAVRQPFEPADPVKKFVAAAYSTEEGRAFFNWLYDLTIDAPYPHVGSDKASVTIAAAKHEARAAVGRVVFNAMAQGHALLNRKEPQP